MKRLGKYVAGMALAALLSIVIISTADAQRGFRSGGGVRIGASLGGFRAGGFRSGISLGFGTGLFGRGYYGYPRVGFHLGYLPYGYYPFYYGADLYYYYGGAFYRPRDGGGYEVAVPPVGAAVPSLPKGAQSIVIDEKPYYEFNGVYYQESVDDKGKKIYIIAGKDGVLNTGNSDEEVDDAPPAPQVGDIVSQLPEGTHNVSLNGKKYFVSEDGIYYEEFIDAHGFKDYRVVSIPSDDQSN
jgi:hypothetical protein